MIVKILKQQKLHLTHAMLKGLFSRLTFTSLALLKIYILTVKYRAELGAFTLNPIQESLTIEGTKQGGKS